MARLSVQPLEPGSRIDSFIVERVVARNAESVVYRVRDSATGSFYLAREYAPARLAVRGEDGRIRAVNEAAAAALTRGVARFLADAAHAAAQQHPSLARMIRGLRDRGTAFHLLVCPPGRPLADLLEERAIGGAGKVARTARSLLDALEFLHARERVHAELAPGLVFVAESGDAVLVGGALDPTQIAGDADDPYAPIELVAGGAEVGAWTDIYRLAAILYHCLAGQPPAPPVQRQAAVEAGEADPLRQLAPTPAGDPALEELRTLVDRGLRLEPRERPQSLREWRARIVGIGPVPHDPSARAPGAGAAGLRRFRGWLAGIGLVALLAGGAYLISLDREQVERPGETQTQAERARAAVETERWRQALETNAVVGYRSFIDDFPDSNRVPQAREYIGYLEEQAWPAVLEENSQAGYEAHLDVFPDGRYATEARARIEAIAQELARAAREKAERERRDAAAWEAARAAGTVAALDGYLADWPGGAFVSEARARRQQLQAEFNDGARFEQARTADTIAAYRGYIADFPAGRHVAAALLAIDRLTLRPGKTFRDCVNCPEMVVVPAGAFWQGSADAAPLAISLEKPRRRVTLAEPFAIGTREVTMRQWDDCVAAGGCERSPDDNGWGRGERPVMLVSWMDAMAFAEWLSRTTGQAYSLPSESEWEYAARAGEESDWPGGSPETVCAFGNVAGAETDFAWRHKACSDRMALSTSITGSYKPNAFGLYDVIGNVAEWTLDCMNLSYLEAPTDGSAWSRGLCSSRMTRGGSWFSGTRDIRLPARFNLKSGDRNDFTGFRVVRRVEPQQE